MNQGDAEPKWPKGTELLTSRRYSRIGPYDIGPSVLLEVIVVPGSTRWQLAIDIQAAASEVIAHLMQGEDPHARRINLPSRGGPSSRD